MTTHRLIYFFAGQMISQRWVVTAAHCCSKESTAGQSLVIADRVIAYFGEHTKFTGQRSGPALKPERD